MLTSGRWPPAVPMGGFVKWWECQLLQLRPGAFDAPPLPFGFGFLGFWVLGVSEASDLLLLFNKKQIRFF